jgi:RNA polymerase sigma factor (sigma-70 family)
LIFSKVPIEKRVITAGAVARNLVIPPGDPHYESTASFGFKEDSHIDSLHPHMHVRGKDFLYRLVYPDGTSKILLSVPRFDFGWQLTYFLKEPIAAPKDSRLEVIAHHDNAEEIFEEKQLARDVSKALNQAIAELDAEDKLLLKMYYYDELKLKEIGQMMGFHEATASRKIVRIQTDIRKAVERILQSNHHWSEEEVKRYLAETASKLGISLEKLVAVLIIFALVQEVWR